ncbi:hypothetical protein BKA82DRAFT_1000395 [Pisolithus tinctorius]|uniref:Uncharacterized protein n=1 Tax=Pisolithus tinctorius Marx 270 TaxID=870435 RepID=A0A0C3PAI8_PISTI|nr:hypothetical protein BKA82DRAFT_1000395 [Pisolithus tinctorius]KIO04916.1 hypothetical protein M404DRAFT_1000395 [Pisolithus tinctorius Marx 270]
MAWYMRWVPAVVGSPCVPIDLCGFGCSFHQTTNLGMEVDAIQRMWPILAIQVSGSDSMRGHGSGSE